MNEYSNCSCGQKLGWDQSRPWPKTEICPTCGEHYSLMARDMRGTCYCKNDHVWHTCMECKVVVVGEPPKVIYRKPQLQPLCQSCEDLKARVAYLEEKLKLTGNAEERICLTE